MCDYFFHYEMERAAAMDNFPQFSEIEDKAKSKSGQSEKPSSDADHSNVFDLVPE
jgi:hypothetical protein